MASGTKQNPKNNGSAEDDILLKLSLELERRDPETMHHCLRVGSYAKIVMEEFQKQYPLDAEYSPLILQWAATLHDIGKSKIPLKIIMKPTKLSNDEMVLMRKHTAFGDQMITELLDSKNKILIRCTHDVILYHHERYDGNGYPNQFKGDEIPISAQMVGLADCYDALISARSYKPSFTPKKAYNMIMNGECGAFSKEILSCLPALVDADYVK